MDHSQVQRGPPRVEDQEQTQFQCIIFEYSIGEYGTLISLPGFLKERPKFVAEVRNVDVLHCSRQMRLQAAVSWIVMRRGLEITLLRTKFRR
jgi:hypothetical protein